MTKKLLALAAGAAVLALTGTASAAPAKQAMQLSDKQMDRVSAGAITLADAASVALGEVTAVTFSQTSTYAQTVNPGRIAVAQAFSQALASGGFFFQAGAISHAQTAASLP